MKKKGRVTLSKKERERREEILSQPPFTDGKLDPKYQWPPKEGIKQTLKWIREELEKLP